uniref:Putative secreted protein 94 n=1 Tax=Amblyomma americanum TaxID=6943 RepID=A0A0C9RXY6_AMBAM
MFFVAVLISVFALVAAESKPAEPANAQNSTWIYNRTLHVVQRQDAISLLWYSTGLERKMSTCLVSHFIREEENGARRTLETNTKFTPTTNGLKPGQRKENVTVTVQRPTPVFLVVKPDKGELDPHWSDQHVVVFATGNCFVMEVLYELKKKPYCVVWGVDKKKPENHCIKLAENNCTTGSRVDLTNCEPVQKTKKPKVPIDNNVC